MQTSGLCNDSEDQREEEAKQTTKETFSYRCYHFLCQVSTVELRYPLICHSIKDGCQIQTSDEESREEWLAVGKEQVPKGRWHVVVLNFGKSFSYGAGGQADETMLIHCDGTACVFFLFTATVSLTTKTWFVLHYLPRSWVTLNPSLATSATIVTTSFQCSLGNSKSQDIIG